MCRAVMGCDLSKEKQEQARIACPGLPMTDSYEEMLANPEVQIVAIYTPDPLHADQIIQAFRARKNVICTKPLINDASFIPILLKTAEETGCRLQVGQSTRFYEPFLRQRELFEAGQIGEVEVVAFPAIVLVPGTIEYDTEPRETRVLRTITGRWTIHVTLLLQTRTDAVRKVERFIRDVHKAWNVDRRRGNYALDSKLRLSTPYYPSDPDDDVCGAYMEFEVWFRTALDDLNSVP